MVQILLTRSAQMYLLLVDVLPVGFTYGLTAAQEHVMVVEGLFPSSTLHLQMPFAVFWSSSRTLPSWVSKVLTILSFTMTFRRGPEVSHIFARALGAKV